MACVKLTTQNGPFPNVKIAITILISSKDGPPQMGMEKLTLRINVINVI